jgi:restriction system protein
MAKKNDGIIWHLMDAPWWVSVLFSTSLYFGLGYIVPSLFINSDNFFLQIIGPNLPMLAPYFAFLFIIPAPIAFFKQWNRKQSYHNTTRKIKQQNSTEPLREINWIEFESYVGEFFKSQGYNVKQALSSAPDGGIDIELTKDGELSLVQCKHWKTRKVGVQVLREMYGVMLDNQATRMIIVTSGDFTKEAIQFGIDKRFWLVNGGELVNMIESGRYELNNNEIKPKPKTKLLTRHTCPNCQSELVLRTAKRGININKQFYGCSSFPKCRYTSRI